MKNVECVREFSKVNENIGETAADNLKEAKKDCINQENCQAVYDVGCDERKFSFCEKPLTLISSTSSDSCVYAKKKGK